MSEEKGNVTKVNVATLYCGRFKDQCCFKRFISQPRCRKCQREVCDRHMCQKDGEEPICEPCKFIHYGVGASNWYYEEIPRPYPALSDLLQQDDGSWPSDEEAYEG